MCRGFQQDQRQRQLFLTIRAFQVRILFSSPQQASSHSLTLHFPPRINGSPLEINGVNVRPDTPAFVTLHRVISPADHISRMTESWAAMYGSRERVRASEGLRFEIYASEARVLKGTIRKDEEGENWKLEYYCRSRQVADVWVEAEGGMGVMCEKVEMGSGGDKTKRRSKCLLEEIPEQRELEADEDGCCSCCSCDSDDDNKGECRALDGDERKMEEEEEEEVKMEGARWAVDVGISVVCLGVVVGYSLATIIRQRKRRSKLFYF